MTDTKPDDDAPDSGAIASSESTRKDLLAGQARGYTQIRNVLVQLPEADVDGKRASVLARAVTERRRRELLLYLLLLGARPVVQHVQDLAEPEWKRAPLPSEVWMRALTVPGKLEWSSSALSRAWKHLEEMHLITSRREKRSKWVYPCREDGVGADYEKPGGRSGRENHYFILPDTFWHSGLFAELSLPGLAMLLFFLKETNKKPMVEMPAERIEEWYGISRRSAQNGIDELHGRDLLLVDTSRVAAPLSGVGYTYRNVYRLREEYSHASREALRKEASGAVGKRQAANAAAELVAEPEQRKPMRIRSKPSRGNGGDLARPASTRRTV